METHIHRGHQHNLGFRGPPVDQVRQLIHLSSDLRHRIGRVAIKDVIGPKQDQDRTGILRNRGDDLLSSVQVHGSGPAGTSLVQRLPL
jgi:hypothetical protein